MAQKTNSNQFREDEIVILTHWDKREQEWVKSIHPKIAGRLRLAHEDNEQLSITSEIITYDGTIAVVKVVASTAKGDFPGLGMASMDRDQSIAPAILELAETRAIARSLRFAGYGVEYCSAEEISHLENGDSHTPDDTDKQPASSHEESDGGNGGSPDRGGNGGGNSRITHKQLNYLVTLGKNLAMDSKDLDSESVNVFGVTMGHLTVSDASSFIDTLKRRTGQQA
jgi:hypothetical protein